MLGKLAKWLKILGFDVTYFKKIEDSELLHLAEEEGRILLTRDGHLIEKAKELRSLFIESESWREQVEQVLGHFNLWSKVQPHSRCIDCNVALKNLPKKRAKNLVSSFVFEHSTTFALCPRCGRVFWKGTHFHDMEFKIEDILRKRR